jgi:hypothetical protein
MSLSGGWNRDRVSQPLGPTQSSLTTLTHHSAMGARSVQPAAWDDESPEGDSSGAESTSDTAEQEGADGAGWTEAHQVRG